MIYGWQKRSAFWQAVAFHCEANRKCLQIHRCHQQGAGWLHPHLLSTKPSEVSHSLCRFVLPVSPLPCASSLLCWVDVLLCAFSKSPSGPAGCRKQRCSAADLLRITCLTAVQLGQYVCWAPTCLPTGVAEMRPEVIMGTVVGVPFFSFTPRSGALHLRLLGNPRSLWPPWSHV